MAKTEIQKSVSRLTRTVKRFGGFRKRWIVYDGWAKFIVAAPGALLIWALLDWLYELPPWPLFLLFVAVAAIALYGVVRWLLRPQLLRSRMESDAVTIEQLHGDMDNRLIGSIQLGNEVIDAEATGKSLHYSPALVHALVEQATEQVRSTKVNRLFDRRQTFKFLAGAAAILVIIAACVYASPSAVQDRWLRLKDAYAYVLDTLFPVTMEVEPGDKAVVRGRPVMLKVNVIGARRSEVLLHRTDVETGETETESLAIDDDERAEFELPEAIASFTYKFEYGRRYSDEHHIKVEDLPEIKAINYEMTPPQYTGQAMRMMTGRLSKLQGLSGTAVLVSFGATTPLHAEKCYVLWPNREEEHERQRIDISGRFGSFAFVIEQPERLEIHLTGLDGDDFKMENPLSIQVTPTPDRPPSIQLLTKVNTATVPLGIAAGLSLKWFAKDDFGIQETGFKFVVKDVGGMRDGARREGGNERIIDPPRDRAKGTFGGIFSGINPRLGPGDEVLVYLTAKDNNTETGPGRSESERIEFRVIESDLGGYVGATVDDFGFGADEELEEFGIQGGMRVGTPDLLQPVQRRFTTSPPKKIARLQIDGSVSRDMEPAAASDAVSDYLKLLSGSE